MPPPKKKAPKSNPKALDGRAAASTPPRVPTDSPTFGDTGKADARIEDALVRGTILRERVGKMDRSPIPIFIICYLLELLADGFSRPASFFRRFSKWLRKLFNKIKESDSKINPAATSLTTVFKGFLRAHPWGSLLCFVIPVPLLSTLFVMLFWHEVSPLTLHSFLGSLPSWVPKHYPGLTGTTSVDVAGALVGLLAGLVITLLVEKKNEDKADEHKRLVDGLMKLQPIESYKKVLDTIQHIIRDCIFVTEKDGAAIKQEKIRKQHHQRSLYFLNPTAVFGHTLRYNFDALLETDPEERMQAINSTSPTLFRDEQKDIAGFIDATFDVDLAKVAVAKHIKLHFATLDCELPINESEFETEYLNEVLKSGEVVVKYYSSGEEWSQEIRKVVESGANPTHSASDTGNEHPKQVYLVCDEEHSRKSSALEWLRTHLLDAQKRRTDTVRTWQENGRGVEFYPLTHVPFQIVMSLHDESGEGWCLFMVANSGIL